LYDILKDLEVVQSNISMRQLLAMAPQCHTLIQTSLIREINKTKNVRDIGFNLDPNFPNIYVVIDGVLIT